MSDHMKGIRAIERLLRARFDVEIQFVGFDVWVVVEGEFAGRGGTLAAALIDMVCVMRNEARAAEGTPSHMGRDVIAAIFPPREDKRT